MSFRTGIENLLGRHSGWLRDQRLALASHAAAVDRTGRHSADMLLEHGAQLVSLFGPEHGFDGAAGAGARVDHTRHAKYRIPVHSLYGAARKPTPEMLQGVDVIIVDFQNIPARCYTYLATMINIMSAAEEHGVQVIVADRPVPLPNSVDGPLLTKPFESFIAPARLPMAYGMTTGETARWIERYMGITPPLMVARMTGYRREEYPQDDWPGWVNPSPAITSWESALCYLSTVACEALPVLDALRGSSISFQAFSTRWLAPARVAALLNSWMLPGVLFHPIDESKTVLLEVTSPRSFKPVTTGAAILAALSREHGEARLWKCRKARPEFFDKLFGGPATRLALQKDTGIEQLASRWRKARQPFMRQRRNVLLYRKGKSS